MLDKGLLRKIKLIVFDLDGTLLNDENEIGEESIKLVEELKQLGVRFSFATGRYHSAVLQHAKTLSIKTPLITLDGALIKSYPEGKIIFESYVPKRYVKRAVSLADKLLLKIALCHDDAIFYTDDNSSIVNLVDKLGAVVQEIPDYDLYLHKTLEVVVAGDFKDSINLFAKKMSFPFTFGLNFSFYKSQRRGDIYFFETRKHGVDKGTGVKRLTNYLNLSMKETAVLGDWYNDRKMFDTGALKIAVANAVQEIKYHADYITTRTNNEDATAEFLTMVLNAKRN